MSINKDSQKAPNLRFKGFTDDWEERKLKNIGLIQTGNTPPTKNKDNYSDTGMLWVTPTDINYLIISDTEKRLSNIGIEKARIAKKGSILVTCIASIGKNALAMTDVGFNQQINSLTPQRGYDSYFLLTQSKIWSEIMKNNAASGTMQIVNKTDFSNIVSSFPTSEEQQNIGSFFKHLDNIITLHQRKLDQLNLLKEALLQQMFPGKGETVPKLRFAGFEGDWEERKLGEISEMYQPQTITQQDLIDSGYPVFGANGYIGYFSKYNHESGQVTISARGEGTGTPSYVNGPVWITGNSMVINVDESGIDKMFLYTNLLSFSLKKYVTGGAQPQLVREVLIKVPIKIPSNEEQKILGSFFKYLNDTITLQQRKLDQLKNMKQVLLQNMFI